MSTITRRLSVDQYDRMVANGTIGEDDPVELIEGTVVEKMPRNPPHRVGTRKAAKAIERLIPPAWYVAVQEAVVLGDLSKPEPDVSVVLYEFEFDATRDPRAAERVSHSEDLIRTDSACSRVGLKKALNRGRTEDAHPTPA